MLRGENGITLVALIITIIVLIILAAVTIINITQFGIINTAINGSINYSHAQSNEVYMIEGMSTSLDTTLSTITSVLSGIK